MLNIMFLILIFLSISIIVSNNIDNRYYKEIITVEKSIAFFSKTRMDATKMIFIGELKPDSCFFKYIYSATSLSIRALYYHKTRNKALENINVLKEMSSYLLEEKLFDEFKDLTYEQKRLFLSTIAAVLNMYWDTHYVEKLLFKLFYKKTTNVLKNIFNDKVIPLIPTKTKEGIDYGKQLNDISNICYA